MAIAMSAWYVCVCVCLFVLFDSNLWEVTIGLRSSFISYKE